MSSYNPNPDTSENVVPPPDSEQVAEQLARILASKWFQRSPRSTAFLKFVVEQTLAGRADFIKARTIAMTVFERTADEDPEDDPVVRIRAGRVRKALSQYYETQGAADPILIQIPTGSYVPVFETKPVADAPLELPTTSRIPRIAVLPLTNLGGDAEQEYFADGIAEELSVELSRFQELAVLAYWTTSQFRGDQQDLFGVARELNIDFFICGSVRRHEDRIRISFECVRAATGDQIWAERFDRDLTTVALFDIQDEVVRQVVYCIGDDFGRIPQSMFRASRGKKIAELSAYEAVLANHYYVRRLDRSTHLRTRAALEHAVDIEPDYALPWAMLSALYCDIYAYNFSELEEPLKLAERGARQSMTLDPDSQHAHYASAYLGVLTRDHPRIIAGCETMVDLNPNAAYMVGSAGVFLAMAGRFDDAFPLIEQSLDLNPRPPGWFQFADWLHACSHQDFDRALAAVNKFNMPTFFWDPMLRAATLGKIGHVTAAASALQEALRIQPDFATRAAFYCGCFILNDDMCANVLEGLRVAGLCR